MVAEFPHPETDAPCVTWAQTSRYHDEDPEFYSASRKEFTTWFPIPPCNPTPNRTRAPVKNVRITATVAAAALTATLTGGIAHASATKAPTGSHGDLYGGFADDLSARIYADVYNSLDATSRRHLDRPAAAPRPRAIPTPRPAIDTKAYVDAYSKSYTDLYTGLLKTTHAQTEKALRSADKEIQQSVMEEIRRIEKGDKRPAVKLDVSLSVTQEKPPTPKPSPKPSPKTEEKPKPKADKKPSGKKKAPAWVIAINYAHSKLGKPYVWGGESDAEGGYDCSGLTYAAYAKAKISLPRIASDQYSASSVHPKRASLRIGDLVFFGQGSISHVGLYAGNGKVLHAPKPGAKVRYEAIATVGTYYGATRVA